MAAQLAVLGSINLDLVASVDAAPRRGETVLGSDLQRQPGGKGANQAIAAARLGARVDMIGAVGDDDAGRELLAVLREAEVDTSRVQVLHGASGVALIVVDSAGENSIVVCPGAGLRIDPGAATPAPGCAVLAQLEVDMKVVERVARETTGPFFLNASPVTDLSQGLRDRVDLFIVNEGEYEALPFLATAPQVALTLGGEGAVLLRRGRVVAKAKVAAERVVNTVGAGDAFAAALTVALLEKYSEGDALEAACRVGAAAVADPKSQPTLKTLAHYTP
ncbi:MAG: ribokinase [Demequina sp.]|uniref:ribokinase n=1 Tax=Demequina sp. TaxID=2050685 RepID=UPI001991DDCF|nr:ribokinase [Demequina sp.]MBC7298018.1 ribokinase [Demequina sp.]